MIIQCINCSKKFELDSLQIPKSGRNLECGSCGHTWFYKNDLSNSPDAFKKVNEAYPSKKSGKSESVKTNISKEIKDEVLIEEEILPEIVSDDVIQKKKSLGINLGRILSFLFVCIITFIALIIIFDTFKNPLSNIFPNLELGLFNLFEILKDIFLFLKNLLI